jgi:hypothetical protein
MPAKYSSGEEHFREKTKDNHFPRRLATYHGTDFCPALLVVFVVFFGPQTVVHYLQANL